LTKKLSSVEEAILARMNVTNYRLEVSGVSHQERIAYVKESVAALPRLVNTPSSYSFELRLQVNGNKIILLLDPLLDTRFSYRKRAVSAAISPAVAASVCYAAQPYFNPEARVLDNFCGSGTMLFERSFYPHASLIGVDISLNAITSAKEGGHAFLYTVEKQLLEDTVRRRGYKIVSKKTFSAGGLYPTLYILKF
jgi:hypothetical protein